MFGGNGSVNDSIYDRLYYAKYHVRKAREELESAERQLESAQDDVDRHERRGQGNWLTG